MLIYFFLNIALKKSKYVEPHRTIAVNLQHVLTQDREHIDVHAMKDILEMVKHVKVCTFIFFFSSS